MRRGLRGWRAAVTALAVAGGCVPTVPTAPVPATDAEIEAAFSGQSYVGTMPDGTAVCIHHADDGRFLGRMDGLVSGSWTAKDDSLCYDYVQGPQHEECRQVVLAGARAALLFAEVVIGQGHLADGNVCA